MSFPNLSDKEFSEKFISILDLGAKDSTYKFAFARFLLDYSREHDEPCVQFTTIAEYFLKYYWVQECRSKLDQTSQKFMKKTDVKNEKIFLMRQIIHEEFGERYYPQEFNKIKEKEPEKIKNCVAKITAKCFNDVTYAFQNINHDLEDRPFFNYEIRYLKPRRYRTPLPIIDLKNGIILNPKAMNYLKQYNVALEKSVILEWARFIEKFNRGVPELIDKIEGNPEKRGNTTKERKILQSFFKNCFYCNDILNSKKDPKNPKKDPEVEHVIPFSFIREDEMWNFVLSCRECNCNKLGALPPQEFLDCLFNRNNTFKNKIPELEKSLSKLGDGSEKIIQDHYDNAKSHGFQIYDKFPKLDTDLCE